MLDDKDLIRCALLGDQEAQKECTEKGIVLPCPFCGSSKIKISKREVCHYFCQNCFAKAEATFTQQGALASWNTRPAPPIGRCGECAAYIDNKCSNTGYYKTEQGYCNDFAPREE